MKLKEIDTECKIKIHIFDTDKQLIGRMEELTVPFNKGDIINISGTFYEVMSMCHRLDINFNGLFKDREVTITVENIQK